MPAQLQGAEGLVLVLRRRLAPVVLLGGGEGGREGGREGVCEFVRERTLYCRKG